MELLVTRATLSVLMHAGDLSGFLGRSDSTQRNVRVKLTVAVRDCPHSYIQIGCIAEDLTHKPLAFGRRKLGL